MSTLSLSSYFIFISKNPAEDWVEKGPFQKEAQLHSFWGLPTAPVRPAPDVTVPQRGSLSLPLICAQDCGLLTYLARSRRPSAGALEGLCKLWGATPAGCGFHYKGNRGL